MTVACRVWYYLLRKDNVARQLWSAVISYKMVWDTCSYAVLEWFLEWFWHMQLLCLSGRRLSACSIVCIWVLLIRVYIRWLMIYFDTLWCFFIKAPKTPSVFVNPYTARLFYNKIFRANDFYILYHIVVKWDGTENIIKFYCLWAFSTIKLFQLYCNERDNFWYREIKARTSWNSKWEQNWISRDKR